MSATSRVTWEPIRFVNVAAPHAFLYIPVGTPLEFPSYICKIVNATNHGLFISINGIDDIDYIPVVRPSMPPRSETDFTYEIDQGRVLEGIPAGTQFMVKPDGVMPSGNVYVISLYVEPS